ncbi:MAG: cell envelope integrity TolA family protein, partial [Candidatus Eutrophobiaceae bacterium]
MHSLRHYFFLSLILHATVIGILLFLNWQPSPLPVRKTINAPIIQAVAVPAEKIQQELERLNELEKEKERKDQKRLSMLEEEKKRQEQVR